MHAPNDRDAHYEKKRGDQYLDFPIQISGAPFTQNQLNKTKTYVRVRVDIELKSN